MTLLASIGCLFLFAILRIEEIARFAALGAPVYEVLRFVTVLIPQLSILSLPLAILVSTYITWNRFSQSCELLGALTSGIRMEHLLFPSLCCALIVSAVTGYLAIEVTPRAQLETKKLKNYWSQINPTHLLRSERIWQLPGATLLPKQHREDLEVFIFSHSGRQNNSQLIHIDKLMIDDSHALSTSMSSHLIFYPPKHSQYLSLENISKGNYSYFLANSTHEWLQPAPDQLTLKALLSQIKEDPSLSTKQRRSLQLEIPRRLFFLMLPLSFSMLAFVAGFHPDRRAPLPAWRPLALWILVLLASYFVTKGLTFPLWIGYILYLGFPFGSILWGYRKLCRAVSCT